MSFDTRPGTRGARLPNGAVLRFVNRLVARRARKRGKPGATSTVVLTTIGRKSGAERETPLAGFPQPDGSWLVVASAAGAAGNPAWYYNLGAHPDRAHLEVGGTKTAVTATQLHGPERDEAWAGIIADSPRFAEYQVKTDRELPVIRLTPRQG